MNDLKTSDQFKSRPALLLMACVGVVLAYLLVSRAFDTGSYWQYLGTLILTILSIRLFVRGLQRTSK